jgi:Tubulin like
VTFHVCCGLAGGTGSGTVVDVVSQLRDLYPHEGYRIIIYAFLPEEYPHPPNKAKENYHANGYAALTELNALAAGT